MKSIDFKPETGFVDTSYFFSSIEGLAEEIKVRNNRLFFIILALSQLIFLIYFIFFIEKKGGIYYVFVFVIFFSLCYSCFKVIDRSVMILINRVGISLENKKIVKWGHIQRTLIKYEILEDGESNSTIYYLVIEGDNCYYEIDLTGLRYNYEQIANVVENFKRQLPGETP